MSVKLYEGCWGVTRAHEVVGPLRHRMEAGTFEFEALISGCWMGWKEDGYFNLFREPVGLDIIAVFPSESAARAWVNRKSLLKRLWAAISKHFWLAFGGPYSPMEKGLLWWAAAALCAALLLTSCAPNRPYPHGLRCTEDGAHTHTTNGDAKRPEGE